MVSVALTNVTKRFSSANGKIVTAVRAVSFAASPGELLALVGPSGCGKTTTLRLIAGLESPDAGTLAFNGQTVNDVPPGDRGVAMVFQRDALLPHLTAGENLGLGLKLRGVPRDTSAKRVAQVAATLGLNDCLARRPGELSGGQRQRVALARALVRQPKILLLDEPFANLDAPLRRELRQELLRLQRELSITTIMVTHDQTEALVLGQRVAVMNSGRIEQLATPEALRSRPASPFVTEFLRADLV